MADAKGRMSAVVPQAAELRRRENALQSELVVLQQRTAAKESMVRAQEGGGDAPQALLVWFC